MMSIRLSHLKETKERSVKRPLKQLYALPVLLRSVHYTPSTSHSCVHRIRIMRIRWCFSRMEGKQSLRF